MNNICNFLLELDKLKSVKRRSYITDLSRNENSAEHSWHLAIAILTLNDEMKLDIDVNKAIKMALVHDICEIGAGDVSVYAPERPKQEAKERKYIDELSANTPLKFVHEIKTLWEEFEEQSTKESRWVKIIDRILPLMLKRKTEGKSWIEQSITKSQVISINQIVAKEAPEIYDWVLAQIDEAVEKGWLIDK